MNKRQEKKRRNLRPTYKEWNYDLCNKIAKSFNIDPYQIGVEINSSSKTKGEK